MSKIIILVIVILLAIGGGVFLAVKLTQNQPPENSQNALFNAKPAESSSKPTADVTYEDSAGFSFKHPSSLKVTDVTPAGDSYYSMLKLVASGKEGKITVQDTTYKTVDEWLAKNTGAELIGATRLGDIAAKQYKTNSLLFSVAIDQGILYIVESPIDKTYWDNVHEIIVDTFTFADSASKSTGTNSSDNTIYESEEIVE